MRVLILEDDPWIADLLKQIVLSLRPGARVDCRTRVADALAAWQFYEEQQAGLGDEFESALDSTLHRLEPAEQHQQVGEAEGEPIRRAPFARHSRRFPHRVVFQDLGREFLVVAVEHPSREPDYWRDRV